MNTGTVRWGRGSSTQVDLAACLEDKVTCNQQDASEASWNSGWLSATRYTTHTQTVVSPGQIATFAYNIKAPADATGTHRFNGDLVVAATGERIHPEGYFQDATVEAIGTVVGPTPTPTPRPTPGSTPFPSPPPPTGTPTPTQPTIAADVSVCEQFTITGSGFNESSTYVLAWRVSPAGTISFETGTTSSSGTFSHTVEVAAGTYDAQAANTNSQGVPTQPFSNTITFTVTACAP
jgi:hypothetical protein